ncbi:MAG: SCO family protein [Chloroflexota bacterium]
MAATVDQGPRRAAPSAGSAPIGLPIQIAALVLVTLLTLAALVGITMVVTPGGAVAPTATAPTYLVDQVRPAAPINLTGADGRPFSLDSMRGRGALVFFGYTHCPDVCPATVGIIGQVIDTIGSSVGAVFVTVDPERDTVAWLAEYLRYVPKGFVALTGTGEAIRTTADAWDAHYARVEGETPDAYSMTHTANVYLVDQQGLLRAIFPFGTQPAPMIQAIQRVLATPAATVYGPSTQPTPIPSVIPTVAPTAAPTGAAATPNLPTAAPTAGQPVGTLRAELVSSSVWSGGASPVILAVYEDGRLLDDASADVRVQLTSNAGAASGASVRAVAVKPPGIADVSFVATLDIPTPGWWRLAITVTRAGAASTMVSTATATIAVLDPGDTTPLGRAAPTVRTPTLDDVGGDVRELSTDPLPDLRMYRTSTVDALAAHQPFVLVIDSTRFRTSPACGKALVMVRYFLDRWPSIPMIHLEPFEYSLMSDTPYLLGTLSDPTLVPAAAAWGIGADPWPATSMPWIFVVDGSGLVRAKYQNVIGTADVDVILSMVMAGG